MAETLQLPTTSAWFVEGGLLAMSANSFFSKELLIPKPQLFFLPEMQTENRVKLAEFEGKRNCLLYATGSHTFLGIDNKLLISSDLKTWNRVLALENTENVFWHMTETRDGLLFVQEYGRTLTGIYRSADGGETWRRIMTSRVIDNKSRHFHSIAYDPYRFLLVATLGDRNLVKIVVSQDHGETWNPVYTAAYQCLPIAILKDYLVFGMDSAISKGVIIWDPRADTWSTIHLTYTGKTKSIGTMQSSDLKALDNGILLMSTGGGSLLFSSNLVDWNLAFLGEKKKFEAHTISNERKGIVVASMVDSTVIIDTRKLLDCKKVADFRKYRAFLPRAKGLGYILRRLPSRLRLNLIENKDFSS
jgi:hypothetical protein